METLKAGIAPGFESTAAHFMAAATGIQQIDKFLSVAVRIAVITAALRD